jgi:tetratricopeptide (TPR) repeat protein
MSSGRSHSRFSRHHRGAALPAAAGRLLPATLQAVGPWRGRLLAALLLAAAALAAAARGAAAAAPFEARALARVDSLRQTFHAASALAVIDQLLAAGECAADSAFSLALWVRQGELLTSLGRARAGEQVLRRALASAWSHDDSATACAALRWLGVAVDSQGRGDEAGRLYRELLGLSRRIGDRRNEGWALVGLAWKAARDERADEAERLYREAIDLFKATADGPAEAWARNGLGAALVRAGRYDQARANYLAAAALAREYPNPLVACFAANNLGSLEYSMGDPNLALEHFCEAARLNRSLGNIRELVIPGINIALCETELGRLDAAADSLMALLELCRREGFLDLEAMVGNHLGDTRISQGRNHEARDFYRSTLCLGEDAPLKNRVEAVIGLARLVSDPDSCPGIVTLIDDARASLGQGGDPQLGVQLDACLGRVWLACGRAPQAVTPLRRAAATAARLRLASHQLGAQASLGRAYLELGQPDSARAALERATRLWEAYRERPTDPQWREVRTAEGRRIGAELAGLILGESPGREEIREAYECIQRFKARTLLERMSGPAGNAEAFDPVIDLPDLQSVLLDGELLLDFFLGPTRSYLFAVTRDSCRLSTLPPEATLEPEAHLLRDLLAVPPARAEGQVRACAEDDAAIGEAGARLGARLLAGTLDWVRAHRRVLVAPDGALNLLPFETLFPAAPAEIEWVRVPSAAVLARIRSAREQGEASVEAVRAGAEAPADREAPARMLVLADEGGPSGRLRGIHEEATDLARRYRGVELRMLTGEDSVRIEDLTGPWSVYHVASHAEMNDQRPWLSALHLGGAGLRAETIAGAHLPARLACLSSCRTSHGRVLSGEGVLGLSTALLAAGTECVVATLWPVEDRATSSLMRVFYQELAAGQTVAGALERAKRALRADPATRHPFFWAAFVTVGAGEIRVPLATRTPRLVVLGTALGGLLAVAGISLGIRAWRFRRQARVIRGQQEHLMR